MKVGNVRYLLVATKTDGVQDFDSCYRLFDSKEEAIDEGRRIEFEDKSKFHETFCTIVKFDPKTGKEISQETL